MLRIFVFYLSQNSYLCKYNFVDCCFWVFLFRLYVDLTCANEESWFPSHNWKSSKKKNSLSFQNPFHKLQPVSNWYYFDQHLSHLYCINPWYCNSITWFFYSIVFSPSIWLVDWCHMTVYLTFLHCPLRRLFKSRVRTERVYVENNGVYDEKKPRSRSGMYNPHPITSKLIKYNITNH